MERFLKMKNPKVEVLWEGDNEISYKIVTEKNLSGVKFRMEGYYIYDKEFDSVDEWYYITFKTSWDFEVRIPIAFPEDISEAISKHFKVEDSLLEVLRKKSEENQNRQEGG